MRETFDFSGRCQGVGTRPGKVTTFSGSCGLRKTHLLDNPCGALLHICSDWCLNSIASCPGTPVGTGCILKRLFWLAAEELEELRRREKEQGIQHDSKIHAFMKASDSSSCTSRQHSFANNTEQHLRAICSL